MLRVFVPAWAASAALGAEFASESSKRGRPSSTIIATRETPLAWRICSVGPSDAKSSESLGPLRVSESDKQGASSLTTNLALVSPLLSYKNKPGPSGVVVKKVRIDPLASLKTNSSPSIYDVW
jgi:hypothetical protein